MYCTKARLVHVHWRVLFVLVLTLMSMQILITAATPSLDRCPEYVKEDGILSCMCTPGNCQPPYTLNWLDQTAPSSLLVVQAVKRQDEGRQYTCQLTCGGQTSTITYTLKVAYGPNNDSTSISGDLPFNTDGTQVLNLTCLATDVYPSPKYSWSDSLCKNNSKDSICSFVPRREDDLKVVTCTSYNSGSNELQSSKNLAIDLHYPPPGDPHIQRPGQVMKAGNTLTCTVSGGDPPVENITFYCTNQVHGDRGVQMNGNVTSRLTIDTSQATDDNMACYCSAHWAPEPRYYTKSDSASFSTEYPAKMKAFTINGQNITITANYTTNVTLMCEAHGLPSPNITLQGPHDDDLIGNLTHSNKTQSKMEHRILAVSETHMGNYTCIANNSVGKNADTSTFILNVNFPPRLNFSEGPGHSTNTAVNMTKNGIDIELRAHPKPDNFQFTVYEDYNCHAGNMSLDSSSFNATASQKSPGSPYVTCHITPEHNVQKGCLYIMTISNGFGIVQYYFNVTGVPPPPEVTTTRTTTPVSATKIDDNAGLIVGVVVGVAAALFIIIIVVVCGKKGRCCCKGKGKDSSNQGRSNPTFNEDDHVDSSIDEKDSPPLHMSTSKPDSKPAQYQLEAGYVDRCEVRDGVMRKKSARGQAYEVTSLVKAGGTRIAGEATKTPATNSNGGYAESWRDLNVDMPDGQPSVNKAPAHTTATRAGNNASLDHYTSPRGEEYASVGEHGKGGNKKAASLKPTDKTGTAAKPAAVNTGNSAARTSGDGYAKMDDCSGQNPGPHSYTKVQSNPTNKPPYVNVRADRPLEIDSSGAAFDSPGYSTMALTSHIKGNKTSGKETHSGAEFTDARGSDTYDHFSRQGEQSRPYDSTYAHTHDF